MIGNNFPVLRPFILSWNLRNLLTSPSALISGQASITGTHLGEYPIDGWGKYFLETPRNGSKRDISGRSNSGFGIGSEDSKWDQKRTINLPQYSSVQNFDVEQLKIVIKHWRDIGIPDDIPCLAVAIKCRGSYTDNREAQYVTVLAVLNDAVTRIISLDWFEGPLEDCITPEWYMKTTPLLNLKDAIMKTRNLYENLPWNNPSFSIYTIPACPGSCLSGEACNAPYDLWGDGWKYSDYTEFTTDLNLLLSKISDIFSEELPECVVMKSVHNGDVSSETPSEQIDSKHLASELPSEEIEEYTDELDYRVENILHKYDGKKSSLISILLDIQSEYNYLPKDALIQVANKLSIRLVEVYAVATFYTVFSLKPRGKYIINVCVGTACHVRGGRRIVDSIQKELNIDVGETTEDKLFTLETVRCLGACALGPVMVINGEYHGQLSTKKADAILQNYRDLEENT